MNKSSFLTLIIAIALMVSCHQPKGKPEEAPMESIMTHENAPGDSTLYGLACDGCTDSVLVLLPYDGGNPDTFDIINAFHEHRVYGRPHVGDELAVILNPEDKQEATVVINIERLKGQWCYEVMPVFRNVESMPQRIQRRMTERIPDSVKERLLVPREYSIRLKRGNVAQTTGGRQQTTTDLMSPVEYPPVKRYSEWRLYNGHLILISGTDSIPGLDKQPTPEYDTVDIQMLRRDTLVLRFKDHEQGFYRKKETEKK